MLTAGMLQLNGAGRVVTSALAPQAGGNGGTPTRLDGSLCVANAAPVVYASGAGFDASGALCAVPGGVIAGFAQGMPFDAAGKVVTDNAGAITGYIAGLPRTAAGALAVA